MSSCLFNGTSCPFSRCCLNFATPYDLIAHIEDAHCNTPPINVIDNEQNKFVRPNSVYNLFPGGYKPTPVPKVATKLNFECYKKRTTSAGSHALSRIRGSESERTDDGEDGEGDGEERKYKCTVDGCDRRYKNLQGVKYHMRSAHGKPEEAATVGVLLGIERSGGGAGGGGPITGGILSSMTNTMSTLDGSIAATVGQVVSSTTGLGLPPPTPTKYAMSRPHKCPHCCKRYKTTTGMQNHMAAAHNKQTPSSSSHESSAATSSVQQSVHEILARTAKEVQAQEEMREQQQLILEGKTVGAVLQSGMARHAQLRLQHQQQQQMQQEQSTVQQQQPQSMQQQQQSQGGSIPPSVPSTMVQQPSMSSSSREGSGGGGQGMQSHPSHHPSPSSHHAMQQQQQQQIQSQQHLSSQSQSLQHHQQMQQQAYYQQQQMQGGGGGGQPQYMPQRTVREEMMEKMEQNRGTGGGGIALPPLNQPSQRRMSRPSINMHYRDEMVSSSMDPSSSSSMHSIGGSHMMGVAGPSPHPSHSSHPSHPHGPPPTSTVRLLPPAEELYHQREAVQMDQQQHYRVQPQAPYQSMPTNQYQRGPIAPQSSYHHQLPQQQQQSDGYSQQQQRLQYPQEGEGYSATPRVGGPLPSITTSFTSDNSYQYASTNQYVPPQGPPQYGNQSQYGDAYGQQPSAPTHYYNEEKRDGRPMDHHDYSR